MSNLSKEDILATSKGWIASLLNFFPGLGSGYIYQRRWLSYFLTIAAVSSWFATGFILKKGEETSLTEQLVGISGLFLISIFTMVEANLAYKKAINKVTIEKNKREPSRKKGWFK